MKLLKTVKSTFLDKTFILFVAIGFVNTFNGIFFSYIYSKFFNPNLSFVFGYISGLFIAYILNSLITFKEKLSISKFLKFIASYVPNFIIQNVIVFLFLNILGFHKLTAYTLAALIGTPVTFILLKFFAFKKDN